MALHSASLFDLLESAMVRTRVPWRLRCGLKTVDRAKPTLVREYLLMTERTSKKGSATIEEIVAEGNMQIAGSRSAGFDAHSYQFHEKQWRHTRHVAAARG